MKLSTIFYEIVIAVSLLSFNLVSADIELQLFYSKIANKIDTSRFHHRTQAEYTPKKNSARSHTIKKFDKTAFHNLGLVSNVIPDPVELGPIDPTYVKYITDQFKAPADSILQYLLTGEGKGDAYNQLAYLTDEYGSRLAGSDSFNRAADYVLKALRDEGFENVHTEQVSVPKWNRGEETATLLQPRQHDIPILGLGGTVPTSNRGITADAIVVSSLEDLDRLGRRKIQGKIVVYNQEYRSYGYSAGFRKTGASAASKYGAVAVLIKSAASHSAATLATGQMNYAPEYKKIPAAAITQEDAEMFQRMYKRGDRLRIYVRITSGPGGTTTSTNIVAEITGWQYPEQVVLISGHFDSWDVGTGAEDDGGGVMICWEALRTIKKLGLRPKRTIRAVFWTAEEEGLIGSKAYYAKHNNQIGNEKFIFVAESDEGAWTPIGLSFNGTEQGRQTMQAILNLLEPINATRLYQIDDAEDIGPWLKDGVPGVWMQNFYKDDYYFRFHHTNADTMTVFQPDDLDKAAALWTVVAFAVSALDPEVAFELQFN